jgi:hypothetical protein
MVLMLKKKPEDPVEEIYSLSRQFEEFLNRQSNLGRKISRMPDSPDKEGAKRQLKLVEESGERLRAKMYASMVF